MAWPIKVNSGAHGTRPGYGTACGTPPLGNSSLLLRCIYYAGVFTFSAFHYFNGLA